MKFKYLWSCLLVFFMASALMAQGDDDKQKPKEEAENVGFTVNEIMKMTREEKNTMSVCPWHAKPMPLSDNYRENASDYTTCLGYPFAYQLNYRRYCKVCTKIMAKESGDDMPVISKATFERCPAHNSPLKGNPDRDLVFYEKNPSSEMPHAKQYLFKNYCRICTKVYKAKNK